MVLILQTNVKWWALFQKRILTPQAADYLLQYVNSALLSIDTMLDFDGIADSNVDVDIQTEQARWDNIPLFLCFQSGSRPLRFNNYSLPGNGPRPDLTAYRKSKYEIQPNRDVFTLTDRERESVKS